MIIGSHVSYNKDGLLGSVNEALSYGANTFMFYTGAPQNSIRKDINENLTQKAKAKMQESGIDINNVICHAPYIINLANTDKMEFGIDFLKKEISRVEKLGIKYLVLHPGSSVGIDRNVAIANISNALNEVINENTNVMILLETMAGKGTEIGKDLDELKTIIDCIIYQNKIGICIDTCHLNDSGINLNNFDEYLNELDEKLGINRIKCVHLNDSLNTIGSHKDRHANIGHGTIGLDNLIYVCSHPKLKNIPKILETPYINDKAPYKEEIALLREKIK